MITFSSISEILEQYHARVQDILDSGTMFNLVFYAGLLIMILAGVLFVNAVQRRKNEQERSNVPWLKYVALGLGVLVAVPGAITYDNLLKAPHVEFAAEQLDSELELHVVMEYDTVTDADVLDVQIDEDTDQLIRATMELTVEDGDTDTKTVTMVPENDILVPADDDILQ